MSSRTPAPRITSLDQFRGYTVAGMFLVNFLGGLEVTHQVLKHNNTHFSYADSIMPSFLFICGVSYRMTFLRRLSQSSWLQTSARFVQRSLALILLSLMVYGFGEAIKSWEKSTLPDAGTFLAMLIKANLWEVLALIGATQILILPVVARSALTRILAFVLCCALHVALSWLFNYDFVYGRPNWLDEMLGLVNKKAWDGGCFGLISWSAVMLAGTLAYDAIAGRTPGRGAVRLLSWGLVAMAIGYGLSCLATLYEPGDASGKLADSPVVPPFQHAEGKEWRALLAPPPFVPPPPPEERPYSYWIMDKRVVTLPFVLFGIGFASALFGLFVVACDGGGWALGMFRTFGQNPLAAYIIHHFVEHAVRQIVPKDSPLWWASLGLVLFFSITWMFVKFLEKHSLYLRL